MKTNKKLILLLALIFLIITIILIVQTYAKYLSSASGETSVSIARWNIKVNNLSVTENTDISGTIAPVFPGNENIQSNIIAPTAEGYFDLAFDFEAVDVSFNYTINSSIDASSPVKDFVIIGYSVDDGERVELSGDDVNLISEDIPLNSDIKSRNIRIYVKWIDDESASMSNEEDTLATTSDTPAIFKVNISFTQIV